MKKLKSLNPWDGFEKMPNGTKIVVKKKGKWLSFCYKRGKKEYDILAFCKAKPGCGVMDWGDYKNRTKKM